jgi:hypothetical protein
MEVGYKRGAYDGRDGADENNPPDTGCAAGEKLGEAVGIFLRPGRRMADISHGSALRENGGRGGDDGRRGGRADMVKAVKKIDLAPLVRSMRARGNVLEMTVTAGSVNNVKPDLVLKALNVAFGETFDGAQNGDRGVFVRLTLRRKALYVERDGVLYRPDDDIICGG